MTTQPNQDVAVVIDFLKGNFKDGFKIGLEILVEGRRAHQTDDLPPLPPAPEIPALYRVWRSRYIATGDASSSRAITPVPNQPTHSRSAVQDCRTAAKALEQALMQWFQDSSFNHLRASIRGERIIHEDDSVPIIFNFRVPEADQLRRLPWHVWDLFRADLLNAEVVLQAKIAPQSSITEGPLRILAIYGSASGGINTDADRSAWAQLQTRPDVTITELNQPTKEALRTTLNQQPWDVLFFAGHSRSEPAGSLESGTLQIGEFPDGQPRFIAVGQLKEDLRRAVQKGLKLAIFNSCDGLGIANLLAQVKVPTSIVMREPVADVVARRFIQEFLRQFAEHKQFYRAVRAARRELDWLENDFYNPLPSATWLPIVSQNPSQPPLQWPSKSVGVRASLKKRLLIAGFLLLMGGAIAGMTKGLTQPQVEAYASLADPETSLGSRILTPTSSFESCNDSIRNSGAAKMAAGDYIAAAADFAAFSLRCPSDAEVQIYRNNAAVLEKFLPKGISLAQASKTDLKALQTRMIVVAVVVPLRGESTYTAQEILRGIERSQQQLNQRSGGYKVLIEIVNDDSAEDFNLSDQAARVASVLVEDPAVFAVVGHYSSGATYRASDIYNRAEVVAVSPSSTAIRSGASTDQALADVTIDLGEHIFRVSPNDKANAEAIVRDLKRENITSVLMAYDKGGEYSRSLEAVMQETLQAAGIAIKHVCNFSEPGGFNPTACLRAAPKAQALIFLPSAEVRAQAGRLLAAINPAVPIWAGDAAYGNSNFEVWGDRINGTRFAIPWHEQSGQNTGAVFGKTEGKSWRSAMAYDALQAIAKGAEKQGKSISSAPDRKALRAILAAENFTADGVLGKSSVRFDAAGDRLLLANEALTLIVEAVPDGKGGYKTQPVASVPEP